MLVMKDFPLARQNFSSTSIPVESHQPPPSMSSLSYSLVPHSNPNPNPNPNPNVSSLSSSTASISPEAEKDAFTPPGFPNAPSFPSEYIGIMPKSGNVNIAFKNRHFVLSQGRLSYFLYSSDSNPKGIIDLKNFTIEEKVERDKTYLLLNPNDNHSHVETPSRRYIFHTSDPESTSRWKEEITKHINYHTNMQIYENLLTQYYKMEGPWRNPNKETECNTTTTIYMPSVFTNPVTIEVQTPSPPFPFPLNPPTSISNSNSISIPPSHSGSMFKAGEINTSMKLRYFTLVEGRLSYYNKSSDNKPKGIIDLRGYSLSEREDKEKSVKTNSKSKSGIGIGINYRRSSEGEEVKPKLLVLTPVAGRGVSREWVFRVPRDDSSTLTLIDNVTVSTVHGRWRQAFSKHIEYYISAST